MNGFRRIVDAFGKANGLTALERLRMRWNPYLITTVDGLRDRRELHRVDGVIDNDNERTSWVEYWDGERLVHRSAHVRLKKMPTFSQAEQGALQ